MKPKKDNQALGLLGWMVMIGDTHNRLTVVQFLEKLSMALHQGRLEVLHRQDKPVAWMIWQRPTIQGWIQLLAEFGDTRTDPHTLEGHLWLDFWARPFGCDAQLAQILEQRLLSRGIANPKLCWHDPSVGDHGSLNLGIAIENLQGM